MSQITPTFTNQCYCVHLYCLYNAHLHNWCLNYNSWCYHHIMFTVVSQNITSAIKCIKYATLFSSLPSHFRWDELPCHKDPLTKNSHIQFLHSSSWGRSLLSFHKPLTIPLFWLLIEWPVNYIFSPAAVQSSLPVLSPAFCLFTWWKSIFLIFYMLPKCIQHHQRPFSKQHLWSFVSHYCQPICPSVIQILGCYRIIIPLRNSSLGTISWYRITSHMILTSYYLQIPLTTWCFITI
jgi:hypothetical protein